MMLEPPSDSWRMNIRLMFRAMVTRLHPSRTWSIYRSRNWRKPSIDLMMPNIICHSPAPNIYGRCCRSPWRLAHGFGSEHLPSVAWRDGIVWSGTSIARLSKGAAGLSNPSVCRHGLPNTSRSIISLSMRCRSNMATARVGRSSSDATPRLPLRHLHRQAAVVAPCRVILTPVRYPVSNIRDLAAAGPVVLV
jgi:hypothetical protein